MLFSHVTNIKSTEITTVLFLSKFLKSRVYFTLITHLNLGAKFSSEILYLNLDFIRFTVAKVDSHTQVAQIHLKKFSRN